MSRPISSESIDKLAPALVAAQSQIEGAVKDAGNPHFKSRYASLSAVYAACKEALAAAGLSVTQQPFPLVDTNGLLSGFVLRTVLIHESGQFLASELPMSPNMARPQEVGSCLTYARRYGLAAMVGVCPEDDDAEAASAPYRRENGHANGHGHNRPAQPPATKQDDRPYAKLVADAAAKLFTHASTLNRELLEDAVEHGLVESSRADEAAAKGAANEILLMSDVYQANRAWVRSSLKARIDAGVKS